MARALAMQMTQTDESRAFSPVEPERLSPLPPSAWIYPGLGCRYVGMGNDIIGRFPVGDRLIAAAEDHLGYDLVAVCLEGSGRKFVSPRQEAQVIYVLECAYTAVLVEMGFQPCAVSGHSLGSLAAAYSCGALDFVSGLELVTRIESLQEELIDGRGQAMGVIIGLPDGDVESLLARASDAYLANWNSPGQYVIAGDGGIVDAVLAEALARGAKQSRRLPAQRALHTPKMREVADRVRDHLASIPVMPPRVPFISCDAARVLKTAVDVRNFLAGFLAVAVLWEVAVRTIRDGWRCNFMEVGPGNLLTNMIPFIDRTAVVQTASDLLDQKASR